MSTLTELFEKVTYEAWRASVQGELKDVPFEKKLVAKTYEGIDIKPLYTQEDVRELETADGYPGFAPFVRGRQAAGYAGNAWEISQEIAFPSVLEFNTAARNSLERGLTALNIVLDRATRNGSDPDWAKPGEVGTGGLSIATLEDWQKALEGIDLEKVSLFIRSGSSALPFAGLLVALARRRGVSTQKLRGCIEMDPLGVLSHEGSLPHSLKGAYREMAELTHWAYTHAPHLQTICIHGRAWHEAGGSAVQELAFTMATAIDYFRALHERGITVDRAAPRMRLALTVGSNFFMEIAKLRAARALWAQIVQSLGGEEASQKVVIHARTSHRNKTVFDPWVNILRATTEAFAAILGGCDSLQVGAFDETLGSPDDFSRRLARNTQIILQKECDLTHVADPVGGSWYVERLTQELAVKAWTLVQEVEKHGGMAKALQSGFVQDVIAQTAKAREKDLRARKTVLVGTTHYANPTEKHLQKPAVDLAAFQRRRQQQILSYRNQADMTQSTQVLERLAKIMTATPGQMMDLCVEAALDGATLGEITRTLRIQDSGETPIRPLPLGRAAEPFEKLRERVEAVVAKGQPRPTVYLATMGPLAQYRARADFAKAFFETAGLAVQYPKGAKTAEEAALAAAGSGAIAAVLCSTDETYPELVPAFVAALKAKAPNMLAILAGYPEDQLVAHQRSGIDDFIHLRAPIVDTLNTLLNKAGLP